MAAITPSATTTVNSSAVSGAVAVTAGSTVNLALASTAGVRSVSYTNVGNHSSSASNPTITAGSGFTASFTMPTGGDQSYLIQTVVNNGVDTNGRTVSGYKFRFVVGVVGASGKVPGALGEELERGTYGYLELINTNANPTFNVLDYGATGDGSTNDTTAINLAFAAVGTSGGTLVFPPGDYLYDADTTETWVGDDDITIDIKAGAKLNITDVDSGGGNYYGLYFKVCDNITITGQGTIEGRSATTGQLIHLEGCRNVHIHGSLLLKDAGSDAVYVTRHSTQEAEKHYLDVNVDGAARNGVVVTSCDGGWITGTIKNITGDPGAGVQVEPGNESDDAVKNFRISVDVDTCTGNGIALSGDSGSDYNSWSVDGVVVSNCTTTGCGTSAADSRSSGVYLGSCNDCSVVGHSSKGDRYGAMIIATRGAYYQGTIESPTVYGVQAKNVFGGTVETNVARSGSIGLFVTGMTRRVRFRGLIQDCVGDGITIGSGTFENLFDVTVRDNGTTSGYGINVDGDANDVSGCDTRDGGSSGGYNDSGNNTITSRSLTQSTEYTSQDLSTWNTTNCTVSSSEADPFGGTDAYELTDDATNGVHNIVTQPTGLDPASDAAIEFIGKAGTLDEVWVSMNAGSSGVICDLSDGTITDGSPTLQAKSSYDMGDGWYWFRMVFPASAITNVASSNPMRMYMYSGSNSYAGSSDTVFLYNVRQTQ